MPKARPLAWRNPDGKLRARFWPSPRRWNQRRPLHWRGRTITCSVELIAEPRWEDRETISRALDALYDAKVGHPSGWKPLCALLRDGDIVLGGLWGTTYWGWLQVELLFVPEALRGQGFGARLLALAEAEAVRRGCHGAWLETMSFLDPPFYERRGYQVFAALENYPPGHQRLFLRRRLGGA